CGVEILSINLTIWPRREKSVRGRDHKEWSHSRTCRTIIEMTDASLLMICDRITTMLCATIVSLRLDSSDTSPLRQTGAISSMREAHWPIDSIVADMNSKSS